MMRIGLVAKGLLIKGDMDLELVLMCRDKPTQTLLDTVCHNLPTQIQVRGYTQLHTSRVPGFQLLSNQLLKIVQTHSVGLHTLYMFVLCTHDRNFKVHENIQ